MAEPFLAEIRLVSFVFAPRGWALCNGQLLPINQNQALFSLLGTTYGGDRRVTFALPDLRGRTPIHRSSGHPVGERGGEQAHTLSVAELPAHNHPIKLSDVKGSPVPGTNSYLTKDPHEPRFVNQGMADHAMHPGSITNVGGSQAHLNMQPFLTLNFIIALQGIFPSP